MRKLNQFVLFVALLFLGTSLSAQVLEPVKWSFSSKKLSSNEVELMFKATIEEHWHLYGTNIPEDGPVPTSFHFNNTKGVELVNKVITKTTPIEKMDPSFNMKLNFHEEEAIFVQKIKITDPEAASVSGYVEFMACDDSRCLPPNEAEFEFNFGEKAEATAKETAAPPADKEASNGSLSASTASGQLDDHSSLWTIFLLALAGGFAAIFTPCVFPMIPMTVSFFLKGSENKARGRFNAISYGLSIIAIYTIIGTIVAVAFGASFANFISTHWFPNILFFIIFMVFAASFFGAFEITMPTSLINKSTAKEDKGGLLGVFFMAMTLVLVSFSCTGPIVGAILVASAGGEVLTPIVGMLGFSSAFALPFTIFALSPKLLKSMPKSGGWLNTVKVVLGFIEVALGFKFLSMADQAYSWGILDREVNIAIWIVVFTLLGLYLLGKLKFKHDSDLPYIGTSRLALAIVTFSFVVYLIPGMFGAPLKMLSGYLPPMQTQDFVLSDIIRTELAQYSPSTNNAESELCEKPKYGEHHKLPHGLKGYFDYSQGLRCAKKQGKPVFIDFTGLTCANCREMEANVWSDPRVLKKLREEFLIIALYVDDKKQLSEEEWVTSTYDGKVKKTIGKINADFQISRFKVNAQPYYCLLDHDGELLVQPKAYDLDVEAFLDFLDRGIQEFKNRQK